MTITKQELQDKVALVKEMTSKLLAMSPEETMKTIRDELDVVSKAVDMPASKETAASLEMGQKITNEYTPAQNATIHLWPGRVLEISEIFQKWTESNDR